MRFIAPFCAFFALFLCSCWGESDDSPEAVVRLWQSYIDRNQFDSARLHSTELARSYIDFLDALVQGDTGDVSNTVLYQLECDVRGDSAVCHYLIEGELEEKIPDTLVLYRIRGRWLVHRVEGFMVIPVDTLRPGEERLLFPGDSLDVELE
ncbi:MAG: hypothetical protein ABMA02_01480 [Saprospiraceae bacterium]